MENAAKTSYFQLICNNRVEIKHYLALEICLELFFFL